MNEFKVLIVDDDDLIRESMYVFLEDNDFIVYEAANGPEGIEKIIKYNPDLVLLDLKMPGMHGRDVLKEILNINPELPVIIVSGNNQASDVIELIRLGAWDYVIKPIMDMDIFLHIINKTIDRVELMKENKKNRNNLEKAYKELESFSYTVSHDLKTPLNVINWYSHMLKSKFEKELGEIGQEFLKQIENNLTYALNLINSILDLSKISRVDINIENFNISELFNELISEKQNIILDKSLQFEIQENLYINADKNLIQIILQNFIDNSIKYCNKDVIKIEFGKKGDIFFIKDNGAGFESKYSGNIFEEFKRLHSNEGTLGLGIGLSTVKKIIERHNGEVWADSSPDKGAIFYFRI